MLKTSGGWDVATLSDALGWQRQSFSAKVEEHCALTPRNPETHAKPQRVARAEAGLEPGKLPPTKDRIK